MNKIAHIYSNILSPILVPTYGAFIALWLTNLCNLSLSLRWNVVMMTLMITAAIPAVAIFILWKLRIITDPGLNIRTERFIPYGITALCYVAETFYLWRIHAPQWMYMFMIGGLIAALICVGVNVWWKISAHMAAGAGLVALLFRIEASDLTPYADITGWILLSIVLLGALGTSRLMLERHTFWQVVAGSAVGFCSVWFVTMI